MSNTDARIHELPELRDRCGVFRDRDHAGEILAGMLEEYRSSRALVLGIPAGGVPVAAHIARALGLALDVAVVSKILLPWTTEAGYGAVAFDGSVWLNAEYLAHYGLSEQEVKHGTRRALEKVERRVARFRGGRPFPGLQDCPVILVDDGIAAGSTLRAAVAALRRHGADRLVIAVPTGHGQAVQGLVAEVDALYCANIRHGRAFAVADAYEAWSDLSEDEVAAVVQTAWQEQGQRHAEDR